MEIRLRMDSIESFADGIEFGEVGPYVRLTGSVNFAIDPNHSAYSSVVDLPSAPRNNRGLVDYSADLCILKPAEQGRGNGRLLYDVNNRGNKRALTFFNDSPPSNDPRTIRDAGNGFLFRRGYSIVWSGWQGDLLPGNHRMTITLPTAEGVKGPMRAEFIASDPGVNYYPLSGNDFTKPYATASINTTSACLTTRQYETAKRATIPSGQWEFASVGDSGQALPSPTHCYLPAGFKPGWIYELVYTAKDPLIMGLGFTGIRDLLSFFLHDNIDADGNPNPLRNNGCGIEKVYGWGRSQSGRLLREFIYRGYNNDIKGRQVFSAIHPTVSGGGRVTLNYRFAHPGRYPRQHEDHLYASDQFPFAYHVTTDHLTGKQDGILKRPETDPLVVHTQTASEYWERRGSLVHTDTRGNDLPEHDKVRVFHFAGSQHSAIPGEGPSSSGPHKHPSNPLLSTALLRALLDGMDEWATNGKIPPESVVPSVKNGSAVPAGVVKARFPNIHGVSCPGQVNRAFVTDYGPDFNSGIIVIEPPVEDLSKEYTILVSHVDCDGNEVGGVRTPDIEVPLATYTGWNLWPKGTSEGAMYSIIGSYFPFSRTQTERRLAQDTRLSIEERYSSRASYVRAVASSTQQLVETGLLLEEDADRYVERAMKTDRLTD